MIFLNLKNRRGQATTIEYAVLFFIVIAAITSMTIFAKRALQARVRGARNYMVKQVEPAYASNHVEKVFHFEYEPYYIKTETDRDMFSVTIDNQTPWEGHEGKFETGISSTVTSQTVSEVAPAADAN